MRLSPSTEAFEGYMIRSSRKEAEITATGCTSLALLDHEALHYAPKTSLRVGEARDGKPRTNRSNSATRVRPWPRAAIPAYWEAQCRPQASRHVFLSPSGR
jgi:hypothetical protein